MPKLISLAALLCLVSLPVPAVAQMTSACQQRCLTSCPGKGNHCMSNCQGRCAVNGTAKRGQP
jgi:hypothetical protein